jgi:hypothetical protein
MTGPHQANQIDRVRAFRGGETPVNTSDCLDEDSLAAMVEGTLPADARAKAVGHLARCEPCRKAVASVARALADPEVAGEIRAVEKSSHPRHRRLVPVALSVAAAAVLLLMFVPRQVDDPRSPHRAPPITAAPAPSALSPVGRVSETTQLRWTAVSGADRYRVTLFDPDGSLIYEAEVADTNAILPRSVPLLPDRTYAWRVEARLGFDRWAASDLIEFTVVHGQ